MIHTYRFNVPAAQDQTFDDLKKAAEITARKFFSGHNSNITLEISAHSVVNRNYIGADVVATYEEENVSSKGSKTLADIEPAPVIGRKQIYPPQ